MSTAFLDLDPRPSSWGAVALDILRHRAILMALARTDFQARYRRAVFGVLWAVAVPLVQAAIVAAVFSHVVRTSSVAGPYGIFVLSGVVAWSYFAGALGTGATAVVDGADLSEKLWFPRAMLPVVPLISGLVGLGISLGCLLVAMAIFGAAPGPSVLLLVPAVALLVLLTTTLALVLAAIHVYFRDVRYLVQAALLIWFYATPVLYPGELLGRYRALLDINPLTGVIELFHAAALGWQSSMLAPVAVSVGTALVGLLIAAEIYRRHDRLFADRM
jgi:lipopolysaccharide transport system permease protein